MRILEISTFIALVRNRHFGRTAQELHTTQPAISARLVALEEELGCRLINRVGGDFSITPEGEIALRVLQNVIQNLDYLKATLRERGRSRGITVRIGAIDSVSSSWMPGLVESLQTNIPNRQIELTVEGTERLLQGIRDGKLDLIFCLEPAVGEGYRSFVCCEWEMIWVGSPKLIDPNRIYGVDELSTMPIVSFPKGTIPFRRIAPYFEDENLLVSKLISSNSMFAIINLVIEGFGISNVPAVAVSRELRGALLNVVRAAKPSPPLQILGTFQTSSNQDVIGTIVDLAKRIANAFHATDQ